VKAVFVELPAFERHRARNIWMMTVFGRSKAF
jgi:hypothetical protein